ncbi:MAG: recombinase family protein [Lachnospiraceae bacterium]|nr:recombinase family protein [Lachnospiraceae bacterium]
MSRVVAIYARVSTEHEAQLSALENQVQYYNNVLKLHPDWKLYRQYIDEGITGTSVKKRKAFLEMMEDAARGCFDLIVTREVSRFARNTVDTLQETRKLKRMGVEVYFTEDNIWTMNDEDGELRLTLMATLAQNESKKTSIRVKAGMKVSYQNAIPYGNGNILGYDRVEKERVINPEQAETVRMIFDLYLSGMGLSKIQRELEKRGRRTSSGLTRWHAKTVSQTLRNPFYCGTIVYRKEFVPDYLDQRKVKNHGEVEQVVVEGKHTPIVTKEEFARVQELLDNQNTKFKDGRRYGVKPLEYIWCQKLKCTCGHRFNRRPWSIASKGVRTYCYQCYSQKMTGTVASRLKKGLSIEGICDAPIIAEWKLETMLSMLLNLFLSDRKRVLQIANSLLEENFQDDMNKEMRARLKKQERQLKALKDKQERLVDLRLNDEITRAQFHDRNTELTERIDKLETELEEIRQEEVLSKEEVNKKLDLLKYTMKQDFSFTNIRIPDTIIDAFVKEVIPYNDHFVWRLRICEGEVGCSVEGTARKPRFRLRESKTPGQDDSDTGRDQGFEVIIRKIKRLFQPAPSERVGPVNFLLRIIQYVI